MLKHAHECDEIWHAGDWGDFSVYEELSNIKPVIGVYGNIDNREIKNVCPEEQFFNVEGLKVYIIHIGGYPPRYTKQVKQQLLALQPDLYICGHSHICKVMRDKQLDLIHINPGAIGVKGFHKKRTMIRFSVENGNIFDLNVIEYDKIHQ